MSMITSQTVLDVVLGVTPVPGLSAAFTLLKLIVSSIEKVKQSKQRLVVLAQSAGQLLQTLNTELCIGRLVQSTCQKPLKDLYSLLVDIQSYVGKEETTSFFKAVWKYDSRMERIDGFYRRLGTLADAFQISALLNIQHMISDDILARQQDRESRGGIPPVNFTLVKTQATKGVQLPVHSRSRSLTTGDRIPSITSVLVNAQETRSIHPALQNPTPSDDIPLPAPTRTKPQCLELSSQNPGPATDASDSDSESTTQWTPHVHCECPPQNFPVPEPEPITRHTVSFHYRKKNKYHCFTNFSPHRVVYEGKEYPTSEHLYQAFKFMDNRPDIAEAIRTISPSRTEAYKYSMARIEDRDPNWEHIRIAKMELAAWHKFSQNPEIEQILLDTGDAELANTSKDEFWGRGKNCDGRNELGKVMERVRARLLSRAT
ncbi:DUF1768 domain-containing protein [Favolaschia claudopus]|uniref:DUF1768 domain-containing protein n=1 Tax=Favolaschia claudopus TaxID=2862362 RepID=A0AAW0A6S4_9AGAR